MNPRNALPPRDRLARSRLLKFLAQANPFARASLVRMARVCGKPACRCARGEKHVSLYLAARVEKTRKMIYIPPELEGQARTLVENGRSVEQLLEEISQASIHNLIQRKDQQP